jgi:hypothetical protein
MNNLSVSIIINQLDESSRRSLRKFLRSPFIAYREDVLVLADCLMQTSKEVLTREFIFQKIYPNQAYNDALLRQTTHWLQKALYKFLWINELENEVNLQQTLLSRAFLKLQLPDLAEKEAALIQNKKPNQGRRAAMQMRHDFDLAELRYEILARNRREGAGELEALIQHFKNYSTAEIFRLACMSLNKKSLTGKELEVSFLVAAIENMENDLQNQSLSAQLYFHSYMALRDNNATHFELLYSHIQLIFKDLPTDEARDILMNAVNFCIRRHNQGDKIWSKKALDLYRFGLSADILLDRGHLSKFAYSNINALAIFCEDWDWARHFLIENKSKLPTSEAESYFHHNLATWHYRRRDYREAMSELQKVEFEEVLQALDARRMLLICYYELDEIDALMSLLESFGLFLRRNKRKIGYHSENYGNLIRFVKRLLFIEKNNTTALIKLKDEIELEKSVSEKNWLLGKF